MTIGVHTNKSALTALQNLNKTNDDLADVQNRVNTGLQIANAKDNAAVWAIAQGQRADIGSLGAVKSSLDRATSIADVASSAGQTISDLLVQMKAAYAGCGSIQPGSAERRCRYRASAPATCRDKAF